MTWSNAYIGLTWGELPNRITCWGLVRRVYAEQLNIALPNYDELLTSIADPNLVGQTFAQHAGDYPWAKLCVTQAQPFDVLVFKRLGLDSHVGIVADVPRRMLHITSTRDAHLADYTVPPWSSKLSGVYRHRTLVDHSD